MAIPFPQLSRAKALESRLNSLFFIHPTYHPSENPIQFTPDIYPESHHFSPSRLPPPFTKALLLSWVTVTTCYLPSPPYSPHSNQSDPYKKNLYAIFIKIQIMPGWCSMCQWHAILIKGRIKVLAWSLRPMTQPCFLYGLISCPPCSAHTLSASLLFLEHSTYSCLEELCTCYSFQLEYSSSFRYLSSSFRILLRYLLSRQRPS